MISRWQKAGSFQLGAGEASVFGAGGRTISSLERIARTTMPLMMARV